MENSGPKNRSLVDDELDVLLSWLQEGRQVALATVTRTWRSSPRAVGSHLVVDQDCNFVGSVSGGCIEAAVITEALETMKDGKPRQREFGVADETAWSVGLSCGGSIQVFVESVS